MSLLTRLQSWLTATRLRIYVVLVLLAIVPLALFLYSADRFLRRDTDQKIARQSLDASHLVAEQIEQRLSAIRSLVESFATRPSLKGNFLAQPEAVSLQLQQAQALAAESSAVAIYGNDGKLLAVYPADKWKHCQLMASHPWYQVALRNRSPYISDLLKGSDNITEIAVSMPIKNREGRSSALLTFFYPASLVQGWMAAMGKNTNRFLFVVDRQGNAIASQDLAISANAQTLKRLEPVEKVIAGESGGGVFVLGGKSYQAAYKPVESVGWGIVIALPFSDIDTAISKFERPLAMIGGIFLVIALALGSLGARVWQRVRDSERKTRTVIETAQDGFIGFDEQGKITEWSHRAESMLGWRRSEAEGALVSELVVPGDLNEDFQARLGQLLSPNNAIASGVRCAITARDRSGREFPMEVSITAVNSGRGRYYNAFIRDITEQRRNQEMIEQKNRELDLRNREVERANQMKSQFLASMSHELRTPLNAILGFSDLLTDGTAGPLTEKQTRWLDHIRKGGKHLLQLINDILDLAKIEAGQVELLIEPFAVSAGLPEVISNVRQLAMAKRIRLEVDCPPELRIKADRLRFKQVLYNLLSNAVKFTPEGGLIRIEAKEAGQQAEFSVTDTGIGMRPEDLEVIFDEFRQVGETTRGVREGTGLGLAITKRLLHQQNGAISVQSEPGKGTRFTFTLPLSDQEAEIVVNEPPSVDSSAGRPLILVIDDEQPARELITGYLNPEGYSTACVNSGIEAVNLARKLRPSCITLDILMPGGSGWETLHELHQHPDTRDIPIIVVSVIDQRRLGMALGASDYLVKPVQREELLSSLERYAVRSSTGVHCVVADDNPDDLRLVADTLAEAGFSHELASNGREALAAMRARQTDVLLLDLTMPVMDGFEVLREMADDPVLCDVPAVVLTGKDLSSDELQMLERSTRGIFQKDGEWRSRLLQSIRRVVRSRAAAQGSAG